MTTPIPNLGNPNDPDLKEYIVTLKTMEDATDFYSDMESEGGTLYVPNREVECTNKRPISRNTHYMLSYAEAKTILNDPRVESVELIYNERNMIKRPYGFTQTSSNFDKRVSSDSNDINWGLLRVSRKTDIPGWGITGQPAQSATVNIDASGKNVDVVIMDDGCPYPTTYEYSQNSDGTGYNRMVEYNWYQHNPVVAGTPAGVYNYSTKRLQEHGAHTTGTVAGNTQGWARDANIYNITFYDSIDYVREFHKNKPINPLTGIKNPTIMNNSWGFTLSGWDYQDISRISYRGTIYDAPPGGWTPTQLSDLFRIPAGEPVPGISTAEEADMIDAINEGIIVIASAGNSSWFCDVPGGVDYNNYFVLNGFSYYYHRGSTPASTNNGTIKVISVGAIGQHNDIANLIYNATGIEIGDYKAEYSNYGPSIDVYAPGSAIQSVWNKGVALYDSVTAPDPRLTTLSGLDDTNNNFKKCPGTSMSGPQVAGVIACLAEKYPTMTQNDALNLIRNVSLDTVLSTNGGALDTKDAGFGYNLNSCRKMLFYPGNRHPSNESGGFYPAPFPTVNSWYRPSTGMTYPRNKLTVRRTNTTFSVSVDSNTILSGGTATFTVNAPNLQNGTTVPYIITAKPIQTPTFTTSSIDGVYNADTLLSSLNTRPNSGNRIITSGPTTAATYSLSNSLLGPAGLSVSTPTSPGGLTFIGDSDDGHWALTLPFLINYCGSTYNVIYIGTNSYITFGAGSSEYYLLGASNPPYRKIMISANDNRCSRIYYGSSGLTPNRTFRIRWEGYNSASGTGIENMIWEAVFYESSPSRIDIHTGSNARWATATVGYPFSASNVSVPLTGNVTINNGVAVLPVTFAPSSQTNINFRLGIFPSPNVNVFVG